jgi:hypothetical protein
MSVNYREIEHYPEQNGGKPMLRTTGCYCCSRQKPMTARTLQEAIQDAEEWLEDLKSYVGRENEIND